MTTKIKGDPIEILLIEDNPGDIEFTRIAFKEYKFNNKLNVVRDGESALDYLHQKGKYQKAVKPDIIILDLTLPGIDGFEVLTTIKKDEKLENIPVVILTSSDREEDIEKAYENYASCFVSKPLNFEQFVKIIKSMNDFWLSIVTLPGKE